MKDKFDRARTNVRALKRTSLLFVILTFAALIFSGFSATVRSGHAATTHRPLDTFRSTVNSISIFPQERRLRPAGMIDPVATFSGSVIPVTTTAQGIADDGQCSLQEAIYSANLDFGVAPSSFNPLVTFDTGCQPGSGDDTIVLEAGKEYPMTAVLDDPYNPMGPTANPIVLSNMTIEANGARLVRANPFRDFTGTNFRAFAVAKRAFADPDDDLDVQGAGTGGLTIRNAHIKGFTAKGGDGSTGGGGGMGAGGAIYVRDARLSVENCTFQDNGAGGGDGSWQAFGPGGGGGGMGGDGGIAQTDTTGDTDGHTGGGGGGARGDGSANGSLISVNPREWFAFWGGGGGGTLTSGGEFNGSTPIERRAGYRCGGQGADFSNDGSSAHCPGGGGGGGGNPFSFGVVLGGNGGHGNYGGGGGGGAFYESSIREFGRRGGRGGFGGGGGAGGETDHGGPGGFGGGGGAGSDSAGAGGIFGYFGGGGSAHYGGGGAGLGGAIFSHGGTVTVWNSTFTSNYAVRGTAPNVLSGFPGPAENGGDAGGAIFTLNGTLELYNATISRNETTGDLGGVVVLSAYDEHFEIDIINPQLPPDPPATLITKNTIIANNGATVDGVVYSNANGETFAGGLSITKSGSKNLIVDNHPTSSNAFPGVTVTDDPQLEALALNEPGLTPTMALSSTSPAINAGVDLVPEGITTDQRGVRRREGEYDIGAYELWVNTAPEAVSPDPAPNTNEDNQVPVIMGGTDADEDSLTFAITDPPDHGALGAVRTPICTAGNCIAAVTYFPAANYNGQDSFKFKVNDSDADSGEVTVVITVNPVNDAPSVNASPSTQADVQYSDPVQAVTITAADLETPAASLTVSTSHTKNGDDPVAGLPSGLTLTDNGVNGSGARQWILSGNANVPAGTYVIKADITDRGDPDIVGTSPAATVSSSFTLNVIRENAAVTASSALTAVKVATAGGTSPEFELSAAVVEEADGSLGDISRASPLTFTLSSVGGGTSPTCTNNAGTGSGTELTISCSFSNVRVGVYEVSISVGGEFYTGGGSTVLTVYDPSLGNVMGSGWLINPITGYRANFGVNVKYLKNGMAQGQVLYIEHRPEGDFKVKSNAMQNAAILRNEAQITAKAIYLDVGNYVVIARVIDNKDLGTDDKFGLKLIDPAGRPVADLNFINSPVPLGGGNNLVPKK